ncbi:predicted protein [Lichtheimia corymbifera JMRC:FSU:9682]|uniref:Membrane anchor Opy2 N-terminal domain-containing protein n=1 Tax=Lichtheimia corymbifera JMRC:FSU:9682 TaxID=1263082 RepID=A0A068RTB5_9FUNG|nr:predicted protein [Lichtheimia corymbifera JMRC:FSU:9682]
MSRRRRRPRLQQRHENTLHLPQASCQPACDSSERCIANVNTCSDCPPAECVSLSALELSSSTAQVSKASDSNNDGGGGNSRVGLIAGLTTGLVVGAIIIVSVAGFVFYRRRKQRRQKEQQQQQQYPYQPQQLELKSLGPPPPVVVLPSTAVQDPFLPHPSPTTTAIQPPQPTSPPLSSPTHQPTLHVDPPQSPVFMGTSLQIPRLTTPPSTTTIRQSLNLLPSSAITPASACINRSSSVKVTKYDYRNNDLEDEFDDTVQIRRAVSVKKNGLSRSASVGAHPQQQQAGRLLVAKPTMVRIVTRTEGGVTRKASVKSADPAPPRTTTTTITNDSNSHLVATDSTSSASSADHEEDGDDVLLRVEDPRPRTNSWISQQSGEITVIWDRHDNNNAESSGDVK